MDSDETSKLSEPSHAPRHAVPIFAIRVLKMILLLVLASMASTFLASAVHEVLGHALTAIALGGQVHRIEFHWWSAAYTYADLPKGASFLQAIAWEASGVIATTLVGLVLYLSAVRVRSKPRLRLILVMMAGECLLSGTLYAFWNAVYVRPPGDIYYVLLNTWLAAPHWGPRIRYLLIAAGALAQL